MARNTTTSQDELLALIAKGTEQFNGDIIELARAIAEGNSGRTFEAQQRLGNTLNATRGLADMLGRRRLLLEMDSRTGSRPPQAIRSAPVGPTPLARLPFTEAIEELVKRDSRLALGAEAVQRVYSQEAGFALARSNSLVVTNKVQDTIAQSLRTGQGRPSTSRVIAEIGDWSQSYADTVYRTNINTAYTAGRFRQMSDPSVSAILGAFRFVAVGDSSTRSNHNAADGLIAAPNDPIWQTYAPPLGYRCRCDLEEVPWIDLRRMGLVSPSGTVIRREPPGFSNARPDPGFGGGRPDIAIYGGAG